MPAVQALAAFHVQVVHIHGGVPGGGGQRDGAGAADSP